MDDWRSRIVGFSSVAPDTLTPHPQNPRKHPPKQRRLLVEVIRAGGVVGPLIVNKSSGHIIDGHLRHDVALEIGVPKVQVIWIDIPESEELAYLATFDQIGSLAVNDTDMLASVLGSVGGMAGEDVTAWLQSLSAKNTDEAVPDDAVVNPEDWDDWTGHRWAVRGGTFQRRVQLLVSDAEYHALGERFDALVTHFGLQERTNALLWLLRQDGQAV